MTMPTEEPIFEVRATLPDGSRKRLGLYATQDDAADQTRLLASGAAGGDDPTPERPGRASRGHRRRVTPIATR